MIYYLNFLAQSQQMAAASLTTTAAVFLPNTVERKIYGRCIFGSHLHHRLSYCGIVLSSGQAPSHLGTLLYQARRPHCGTEKGLLHGTNPTLTQIYHLIKIRPESHQAAFGAYFCLFCLGRHKHDYGAQCTFFASMHLFY